MLAIFGMCILTLIEVFVMQLIKDYLDIVFGSSDEERVYLKVLGTWLGVADGDVVSLSSILIICASLGALLKVTSQFLVFYLGATARYVLSEDYLSKKPVGIGVEEDHSFMAHLTSEVDQLVQLVITPCAQFVSNIIVLIIFCLYLSSIAPVLFLSSFIAIMGYYALFLISTQGLFRKFGQQRELANNERFAILKILAEGWDLLSLYESREKFELRFLNEVRRYSMANAVSALLALLPKLLFELFIVVMLVVVSFSIADEFNFSAGTIGVFAIIGVRLLPVAQSLYASSGFIKYGGPIVKKFADTHENWVDHSADHQDVRVIVKSQHGPALQVQNLELVRGDTTLQKSVNLSLYEGEFLAIVGPSGSGKSTFAAGLSSILINNMMPETFISGTISSSLQRSDISFIPQKSFWFPGTIRDNIDLLGTACEAKIVEIMEVLGLDDISDEFEISENVLIGPGLRQLSGGQIQRLGIARSLVLGKKMIIADEATSALDLDRSIQALQYWRSQGGTLIMITHNQSLLDYFDKVVEFSEVDI